MFKKGGGFKSGGSKMATHSNGRPHSTGVRTGGSHHSGVMKPKSPRKPGPGVHRGPGGRFA